MPKGPGDEVLGGTINAGDETLEVPGHATIQSGPLCLWGPCAPNYILLNITELLVHLQHEPRSVS